MPFLQLLRVMLLFLLIPAATLSAAKGERGTSKQDPLPATEKSSPASQSPKTEKGARVLDFPLQHNLDEEGGPKGTDLVNAKGWVESNFLGKGNVRVEKDTVFLEEGNDLTGIRWTGRLAKMNYEITLEAMRVSGMDFFCGLTFPYGEDPCSLIVGGWGGTCVGISSLDYNDAYNNETARFITFDSDRWYRIRLRVTKEKIEAWIDDDQVVDVKTVGRKIGIRYEVEPSRPLGIASWRTTAAIRNVCLRAFEE
ncbi:MAG: DUF1080 domain-containing protein [Candidatus Hydrogenedentes bacterium]|nr:DUF1080 domain-containing protein [Candidatus Hydrogenedentota bacterium]